MKMVVQRVRRAEVRVQGESVARIGPGLLTLVGFAKGDSESQLDEILERVISLRIFPDASGKMNLSLKDVGGEHLLVSQFTLAADLSQGRRPSFTTAEVPERARALFDRAVARSQEFGIKTAQGRFGADMEVELVNDGPVTFTLEAL